MSNLLLQTNINLDTFYKLRFLFLNVINSISDALRFILPSYLYLLSYDTYIALYKYKQPNSNAHQNHLELIYRTYFKKFNRLLNNTPFLYELDNSP